MTGPERSIFKTRLRNGLEVRLKEIRTAPLISSWIWYRVGSRNEHAGITGVSHWVEHMQFKGTPAFPSGKLDRAIARDGGYWNAFTWLDWTAYFETMPADRIDLALRLESDRMVNSKFSPRDVKSERTVIISEREGKENEPTFRLAEEVQAAAFRVHSYHHSVIGDMADLRTMTRDHLYQHYRSFYIPNNAILAIAGDFRIHSMLKKVRALFGPLSRQPYPEVVSRPEPTQEGERRVTVEGPGDTPFIEIVYHAPAAEASDFQPLAVLDSILAGASNLNFFGAGISNKTSRLYRALVEGEFAAAVRGGLAATLDPYLYSINITVPPDSSPEDALRVFDQEVDRVLQAPIEKGELSKAIKQARALFAYNAESITNQAFWMGYSEMFADYAWFESYLEKLTAVTPEAVLSVARRYLVPTNRVVGIYRPVSEEQHGA